MTIGFKHLSDNSNLFQAKYTDSDFLFPYVRIFGSYVDANIRKRATVIKDRDLPVLVRKFTFLITPSVCKPLARNVHFTCDNVSNSCCPSSDSTCSSV